MSKIFFSFFILYFCFLELSASPLRSAYANGLSGYIFSSLGSEEYPSLSGADSGHRIIFSQHFFLPINYTSVLEYSYHFARLNPSFPLTLKGVSAYDVYLDDYSEYGFSEENSSVYLNIFLQQANVSLRLIDDYLTLGANLLYYHQNSGEQVDSEKQEGWGMDIGGHGVIAKKEIEKYLFGKINWAVAFKNLATSQNDYYLLQRQLNLGLFYESKKWNFKNLNLKVNTYLGGEFFEYEIRPILNASFLFSFASIPFDIRLGSGIFLFSNLGNDYYPTLLLAVETKKYQIVFSVKEFIPDYYRSEVSLGYLF